MKRNLLLLLLCFCCIPALASHLKGGFFTYVYQGPGLINPAANRYKITLTEYMDPSPGVIANPLQNSATVNFSIYNMDNGTMVVNTTVNRVRSYTLKKTTPEECIVNAPPGDVYFVVIYEIEDVELMPNQTGYTITYQRCCRIIGIANIIAPSDRVGNTYSIRIPGISVLADAPKNSSTTFQVNDTVVVCRNSFFQYSFQSTDPDGDSLTYSFCDAWNGGSQADPSPIPSLGPPYSTINYSPGFTGTTPLGPRVTIDPQSGLISGIAPDIGEYVVTVCVNEYNHDGVLIASNRKELHMKVEDCSIVRASLDPTYVNCKNFTVRFFNNTPNGVVTNFWDFGVPGVTNDTDNIATPQFSYPDTGLYQVKLVVNRGQRCADSTISTVRVYPGFFPGFTWAGICANHPTSFTDTTRTLYGVVNYWSWNFGDGTTLADTSHLRNPAYSFPALANYGVQLIVGTDKGCLDTMPLRTVAILDKPPITIPFKDTLLCKGDTLQLQAVGNGNFSWTPNGQMINPNSPAPLVWPQVTTTYTATLTDNGCVNSDTVHVRVVSVVSLTMNPDQTICLTDSVRLGAQTDALRFVWRPGAAMDDSTLLQPMVRPQLTGLNKFVLTSFIGTCTKKDSMYIRTIPYPVAILNGDTTICFRASTTLHATHNGTSFSWSPTIWLSDSTSLNPIARPPDTIAYVLTVRDSLSGCPKPSFDTIFVNVMPRIYPDAGNDTMVIAGQPVQLHATGGVSYQWIPATGLNNPDTSSPIGFYDVDPEFIRYKVRVFDSAHCVDSAFVRVRVFRTAPSIFVPTAFTPNGDGRNDIVKPIAVGMKKIEWFRIFNRWGQLVFETDVNGAGWDGRIKGHDQGTNVFVWLVKAVDFTGKPYFGKGTVTLIR
jgi:gliding motility-associated-like protein